MRERVVVEQKEEATWRRSAPAVRDARALCRSAPMRAAFQNSPRNLRWSISQGKRASANVYSDRTASAAAAAAATKKPAAPGALRQAARVDELVVRAGADEEQHDG